MCGQEKQEASSGLQPVRKEVVRKNGKSKKPSPKINRRKRKRARRNGWSKASTSSFQGLGHQCPRVSCSAVSNALWYYRRGRAWNKYTHNVGHAFVRGTDVAHRSSLITLTHRLRSIQWNREAGSQILGCNGSLQRYSECDAFIPTQNDFN